MHVYTMGTRAYAEEVCTAIDPDGKIFGGRLLSRDESGSKSPPRNVACTQTEDIQASLKKAFNACFLVIHPWL